MARKALRLALGALGWPPLQILNILSLLTLLPAWSGDSHAAGRRIAMLVACYACATVGWRYLRSAGRHGDGEASPAAGRPERTLALLVPLLLTLRAFCMRQNIGWQSLPLSGWFLLGAMISAGLAILFHWSMAEEDGWRGWARPVRSALAWMLVTWPIGLLMLRLPAWPPEYRAESPTAVINIFVLLFCACWLCAWFSAMSPPQSRLRGLLGKTTLLACSLSFALLATEITFRAAGNFGLNLWEVYDPDSGFAPGTPNLTQVYKGHFANPREFAVTVSTNSLGFHDREHAFAKPAGTLRVAVLGDSFVEAAQVSREHGVVAMLEERLQKRCKTPVEVLGFGRSGWGQIDEYKELKKEVLQFAPDLVVIEFLGSNDVRNNSEALTKVVVAASQSPISNSLPYRFARRLRLQSLGLALAELNKIIAPNPMLDEMVFQEPPADDAWKEAWDLTFAYFRDIDRLCREANTPLLVVAFGTRREVLAYRDGRVPGLNQANAPGQSLDFAAPNRIVEGWCAKNQIAFLNLPQKFATLQEDASNTTHFPYDGHWTARGHSEAAKQIEETILVQGLLSDASERIARRRLPNTDAHAARSEELPEVAGRATAVTH